MSSGSSSSSTVKPLDVLANTLSPTAPAQVLTHLIVNALLKKGFESAEAGALANIQALLEHRTFESASEHATLGGRATPNSGDLWAAYEEHRNPKILRRESKRRRKALHLDHIPLPDPPTMPPTLDQLEPLKSGSMESASVDRKPNLSHLGAATLRDDPDANADAEGGQNPQVPSYAYDWAPKLPGKWTYATSLAGDIPPLEAAPRITSSSLDFVKASVTSGDIPPELGVVNFRTATKRAAQQSIS